METSKKLIEIFDRFYESQNPVRVSFENGNIYDFRIVSTMHAEEGGDIVADVVRSIVSANPEVWKSAAMNFKLDDVLRVDAGDECLFTKSGR